MKNVFPFLLCLFTLACKEHKNEPLQKNINGEALSRTYCASCHAYPEPSLLDKETWENYMLPRMGYMYGIYATPEERNELFENNEGGTILKERNLFPPTPQIDSLHWEAIKEFYLTNAPDTLSRPPEKDIVSTLDQFRVVIPEQKVQVPSSTMTYFSEEGNIYLGDAMTKSFSIFSPELELLSTGNVQEGAVSLYNDPRHFGLP